MNGTANGQSRKRIGMVALMLCRYAVLFGLCFIILYPLFSKFVIAFMEKQDLYDTSVRYIPKTLTLDNLRHAMNFTDYFRTLLKTAGMSFSMAALQVFSSMLAGYGFARFHFPFRKAIFTGVLLTLIVPPQTVSVPAYLYFNDFNPFGLLGSHGIRLLDSPIPLLLLSVTAVGLRNGLFIYMFRQFFMGFPRELEEAGEIDGAGSFQIFARVIAPCSVSVTIACFLFAFVWQWTDDFYVNTFMPGNDLLQTMVAKLPATSWMETADDYWRSIMNNVGILLLIVPLIILYLFLQRYFVESIERAGIVG